MSAGGACVMRRGTGGRAGRCAHSCRGKSRSEGLEQNGAEWLWATGQGRTAFGIGRRAAAKRRRTAWRRHTAGAVAPLRKAARKLPLLYSQSLGPTRACSAAAHTALPLSAGAQPLRGYPLL